VIASHPGSAMTRPNGIVAGTPRERFDLDVARGNLACSAFALTAQRGDTNLAGDKAGFEAQGLWESIFAAAPMTRPSPQ
jgi:hypothetical protein